jgi:hypothetical protein
MIVNLEYIDELTASSFFYVVTDAVFLRSPSMMGERELLGGEDWMRLLGA